MNRSAGIVRLKLRCESQEETRKVEHFVSSAITSDESHVDVFRSYPKGQEAIKERHYRLSDYFDDMQAVSSLAECTIGVVFHVREGADLYWKDAVVRFLRSLKKAGMVAVESVTRTS